MNLLRLSVAIYTIVSLQATTKRRKQVIIPFFSAESGALWGVKRWRTGPTTTVSPWTRRKGPYISSASWHTPYKLGSSEEWASMHKNPNIEYNDQWYKFIYSTEESDPYYSYSWQRTTAFWLKIRNTRRPETSYEKYRKKINRACASFDRKKREKKHRAWLERNRPRTISDEDYRAYMKEALDSNRFVNGTQTLVSVENETAAYSLLDNWSRKLAESEESYEK